VNPQKSPTKLVVFNSTVVPEVQEVPSVEVRMVPEPPPTATKVLLWIKTRKN